MTRHGATDYNDQDLIQGWMDNHLGLRGREQSEKLALRMKDCKLDMIFCSPLSRARQTAESVNQFHNAPIKVIDSFIEMDLGEWEGQNFHQIVKENPEIYHEWASNVDAQIPGGETFRQVFERVMPGVNEVLAAPYESILIAAHAMVNRAILGRLAHMSPLTARRFRTDNCAYSKLLVYEFQDGPHLVVDTWNDSTHLQ